MSCATFMEPTVWVRSTSPSPRHPCAGWSWPELSEHPMKTLVVTLLLTTAALPVMAEDWTEDYRILRIGVTSSENEADRMARWEPWRAYLAETFGVEVEIYTA